MKKVLLFVSISYFFLNCSDTSKNDKEAVSDKGEVEINQQLLLSETETCFLFTEGAENQDSTFVSLKMQGDSVTGFMHWQPWETDGAYGTIAAVMTDSVIRGMYDYTIEGSPQKEEVMFKMSDGKLYKASGELTEDFGEEIILNLKNPESVVYKYEFREIDCALFQKF